MAEETTAETNDQTTEDNQTQDGAGTNAAGERTLSQAEVDRIVQKAKRQAAEAARKEFEDKAAQAAMSETERLKAEKDSATKAAQAATEAANQRIIRAEAKVKALELGFKPERVNAAMRLADLSEVTITDAGEPEADALEAALKAVLAEYPEFKANATGANIGSGSNPASSGATRLDTANLSKDEFDKLTQRIMRGEVVRP